MNAVLNEQRIRDDRERAQEWLCGHLHEVTKVNVRQGVTTHEQRQANIRGVIGQFGLADKVFGKFNDKPQTYRQFCLRALGIDL